MEEKKTAGFSADRSLKRHEKQQKKNCNKGGKKNKRRGRYPTACVALSIRRLIGNVMQPNSVGLLKPS